MREAVPIPRPHQVARELLERHGGDHRAAEVEAWKLRDGHGRETELGGVLAYAACIIADLSKGMSLE